MKKIFLLIALMPMIAEAKSHMACFESHTGEPILNEMVKSAELGNYWFITTMDGRQLYIKGDCINEPAPH